VINQSVGGANMNYLTALVVVKEGVQHQVLLQLYVPVELVCGVILVHHLEL